MKVDIKHEQKKEGFVFKKIVHYINWSCVLSAEERQILEDSNIRKTIVAEWSKDGMRLDTTVGSVLYKDDHEYHFDDSISAKNYENDLIAGLKGLARHIEEHKGGLEDQSFEL